MNKESLVKLCQRQSGNKSADASIGFTDYLNMGQRELASEYDFDELKESTTIALTDGTESYSLPTDFMRERLFYISSPTDDERVIGRINYADLRKAFGNTSDDSETNPLYWYFDPEDSTKIRVFPIPDKSYTLRVDYMKNPTDLSENSDTPFFTANLHHCLSNFALSQHYEAPGDRNFEVANRYSVKWENDKRLIFIASKRTGPDRIDYSTGVNE